MLRNALVYSKWTLLAYYIRKNFLKTNAIYIKHTFNVRRQKAGKDWYYGFLKSHLQISLRKSEPRSVNRILIFSKEQIINLQTLYMKN